MTHSMRCIFALGMLGALLLAACQPAPPAIVGRWRTDAPSSLLFAYGEDGAVHLLEGAREYLVYHYKFVDADTIQLFDGMGRVREYNFHISGNRMTFFSASGETALQFTRE